MARTRTRLRTRKRQRQHQSQNPAGSMGGLLLIGGAALVAYFLFSRSSAAATTNTGTTTGGTDTTTNTGTTVTPNPVASPSTWTPAAAVIALNKATIGNAFKINGKMTADQWRFFYEQVLTGAPSISGVFDGLFFPDGRPADQSLYVAMTADEFINALTTTGGVHLGGGGGGLGWLGWFNDDFAFGGGFKMGADYGNDYVQSMGPNTPLGMSGIIPMSVQHPYSAIPMTSNQVAASPRTRTGAFHNRFRN